MKDMEYPGFWVRVGASLIDTVLVMFIIVPGLTFIYGDYWLGGVPATGLWDILFNFILPGVAVVLFWIYKSTTPDKMALCLGLIWVGIDRRNQGWHDKLGGTVVIRRLDKEPVQFETPQ